MKRLLLTFAVLSSTNAVAAPKGPMIPREILDYRLSIEMSCRDSGSRRGLALDVIEKRCTCVVGVLDTKLSPSDWRRAQAANAARKPGQEGEVLKPHMADMKACGGQ